MKTAAACLWDGKDLPSYSKGQYDPEDAVRLCRNFRRHIPEQDAFEFLMFVDAHYLHVLQQVERPPEMRLMPLPHSPVGGWTPMFGAMHPDFTPRGTRTVLVGLDTVIMSDPSWLWSWNHAPVGLPLDPYAYGKVCNAAASFDHEGALLVWKEYQCALADGSMATKHLIAKRPSEMMLLRTLRDKYGWLTYDETDDRGKLYSYKMDVRTHSKDPHEATMVYFHGSPKVRDLPDDDPVKLEWLRG